MTKAGGELKPVHAGKLKAMVRKHDMIARAAPQESCAIERLMKPKPEGMGMTRLEAIGALETWKRQQGKK